jgi:hypothetical protein
LNHVDNSLTVKVLTKKIEQIKGLWALNADAFSCVFSNNASANSLKLRF